MATTNTLSQKLLDLLATRNVHPEMLDKMGKPTDAENAKTFTFDYTSGAGKNYGTMVIVLDVGDDMKIMYGDNLGRTMEGNDKDEFFNFLEHLNQTAVRSRWTHTTQDISQLKHTMQGMAAIQEGLFEGYYGTRKVSYAGQPTEARLQIVHSQPLGEGDARYRHIAKMYIETAEGERFKLGFKSLAGGKAMLEHVRQGGKPYDIRGCHITETVNEIAVLSRFNRASATRIVEGTTQELITEAQAYYQTLKENLKHMATSRGYAKYFESWHPATISEQEGVVDNIKTLFIEQSIDSRIEAALPLLAKIQQRGQEMKEADIFESWINTLGEGTWNLPETPEQLDKLKTLMTKELIVGPDATNATEQLYDLIGDDILFDRLQELADRDPRANAWNDTEVMDRIRELGIEMPEPSAPGNPAEPQTGATAPVVPAAPAPVPQQPVAEDSTSLANYRINDTLAFQTACNMDGAECQSDDDEMTKGIITIAGTFASQELKNYVKQLVQKGVAKPIGGAASRDITGMARAVGAPTVPSVSEEINAMRKAAGLPVVEARIIDESGETLEHILDRFKNEVKRFEQGEELDDDLYDALFDYYASSGEMPYGTMKARTGDPYQWITQRLDQELGINEGWKDKLAGAALAGTMALGTMGGGSPAKVDPFAPDVNTGVKGSSAVISNPGDKKTDIKYQAPIKGQSATIGEGSCNMTMEGEYCPEHGLAECGYMESMGGTVAGNVGEGLLDIFRKKPRDPANFQEYMVYDTFTIFYDPTDETFIVKGTGEYENKLPTKEFAANSAMGGLSTAQAYGEYKTGGIKEPLKVNRGVINRGAHEGVEHAKMGEGNMDDAINYNGSITGSYYESKESDSLLARIKSLALLK